MLADNRLNGSFDKLNFIPDGCDDGAPRLLTDTPFRRNWTLKHVSSARSTYHVVAPHLGSNTLVTAKQSFTRTCQPYFSAMLIPL